MGNKHRKSGVNSRAAEFLFRGVPEGMELAIRSQALRASDDIGRSSLTTEISVSRGEEQVSAGVEISVPDLTRPIQFTVSPETGDARLDLPGIAVIGRATTCLGIARSITGESDFRPQ